MRTQFSDPARREVDPGMPPDTPATPRTNREHVIGALAIGVVALAGITTTLLVGGGLTAVLFVVVVAAAGVLIVSGTVTRQRARMQTVQRMVDNLLDDDAPRLRYPLPDDDPLAPLAAALERLGDRIREQGKEVARQSSNLSAVIDALDEPIIATGQQDEIILCNKAAETMLGAPPSGLVGRTIGEALTQASLLEVHADARDGTTKRVKARLTTMLGVRTFQVSALPLPAAWGGGQYGVVLFLRDVTELEEAVRVKSDFVANASHELRTPVASIKAAAETLCLHGAPDASVERMASMIEQNAARLDELLRDLLDLSHVEAADVTVRLAPVEMAALQSSLRDQFTETCRSRGLEISFESDETLAWFRSDVRLVYLMIRNLLENALRFANEGTTVRVVATVSDRPRPNATISMTRHGEGSHWARFEVIDRGAGIPIEMQARVFERFFQVEPARRDASGHRGTGLGLALVKHAAGALGGGVGLESTWGRGTRIWFDIPLTPCDGAPPDVGGLDPDATEANASKRVEAGPDGFEQPGLPGGVSERPDPAPDPHDDGS